MTKTITASIFPEIELVIEGEIEPAEKETGPTYDCGGTPGHDAFVSSWWIKDVSVGGKNLLDGIQAVRGDPLWTFLCRLEAATQEEAERALMLEASE